MKSKKNDIFRQLKECQKEFVNTLLTGEDKGHCKGIKKRMDTTIKYKVLQEQKQRQQILELRIENIKQAKKEAD